MAEEETRIVVSLQTEASLQTDLEATNRVLQEVFDSTFFLGTRSIQACVFVSKTKLCSVSHLMCDKAMFLV
jgi:hypothetical protein